MPAPARRIPAVRRALAALVLLLVLGAAAGCSATGSPDERAASTTTGSTTAAVEGGSGTGRPGAGRLLVVTKITDGDTIWVAPEGADPGDRSAREKVRLIGMDTPEVYGDPECFGSEASAALARLIPVGTAVRLVGQVSATDRYGRTLADVYRAADGLFVNLEMVERGYAVPLTIPPDVAHADQMVAAARRARDAGRGLWAAC